MRFYTENVQQDDCTYKKPKSLFPHMRHLLPATNRGKGKEGLTAKSNSVRQYYIMRSRNLSTSCPSGRFLLFSAEFRLRCAAAKTIVHQSRTALMTFCGFAIRKPRSPSAPPFEYCSVENSSRNNRYLACLLYDNDLFE